MPAFFWRHEFCPDRLKEGVLSLMEFAACAGFSAQSHFSYSFNHLAGVTPGQFRMRAKIAKKGQVRQETEERPPVQFLMSRVSRAVAPRT